MVKTIFKVIIATFFIIQSQNLLASITSVSGVISDGETITISGSGFGSNGPTVVLFDDFELGTEGDTILTGSNSAQVGEWSSVGGPDIRYGTVSWSGSLAAYYVQTTTSHNIATSFTGTDKIFFFYRTRLDNTLPGNWKPFWVMDGTSTTDDDCVFATWLSSYWKINGNDSSWSENISNHSPLNTWRHFHAYAELTATATGRVIFWLTDSGGTTAEVDVSDALIAGTSPYEWDHVLVNGFANWDGGTARYDDIYIAIGDYCQARVQIGSHETYANCTNLTVVTPTSWSDTSIEGTFWQGSFGDTDTVYFFVVDSDGNFTDQDAGTAGVQGYEATIGSSTDTTAPAVSGASPSGEQACGSNPQSITLEVTTDESATCKYDTSDVAYDSMTYTFATTGGTTHQQSVDLACGGSYRRYVRCEDGSGNQNSSSTEINFTIAAETVIRSGSGAAGGGASVN